jgi:hypothetical protein
MKENLRYEINPDPIYSLVFNKVTIKNTKERVGMLKCRNFYLKRIEEGHIKYVKRQR